MLTADPPAVRRGRRAGPRARASFGFDGEVERRFESERDQNFLLRVGRRRAPHLQDLQRRGTPRRARHGGRAPRCTPCGSIPSLPVAAPFPTGGDPDRYIATVRDEERGTEHMVRMSAFMPGRGSTDGIDLDHAALWAYGETLARLGRALRGFFHPAADRVLLWNVEHCLALRPMTASIEDPERRALVQQRLRPVRGTRAAAVARAARPGRARRPHARQRPARRRRAHHGHRRLRRHVAHRPARRPDLGARLGAVGTRRRRAVQRGRGAARRLRVGHPSRARRARAARRHARGARGPHRDDLGLAGGALPRERAVHPELGPQRLEHARGVRRSWLRRDRPCASARRPSTPSTEELVARRAAVFGTALAPLTYSTPLHLVRGRGVWLEDVDGRRYLDSYNNVPVVGHAHPRVATAIADQVARAEHEPAVPASARDRARRAARGVDAGGLGPRHGAVPERGQRGHRPRVASRDRRDRQRRRARDVVRLPRRHDRLDRPLARGVARRLAPRPRGAVHASRRGSRRHRRARARRDRAAGGARTPRRRRSSSTRPTRATACWPPAPPITPRSPRRRTPPARSSSPTRCRRATGGRASTCGRSSRCGLEPDLVTLGKPMGNGHPIAAVIARRDDVDRLAGQAEFFSTFGGNPVAAAAGLAVLDVIRDEQLVSHAAEVGRRLRVGPRGAAATGTRRSRRCAAAGLLLGVELVRPDDRCARPRVSPRGCSTACATGAS